MTAPISASELAELRALVEHVAPTLPWQRIVRFGDWEERRVVTLINALPGLLTAAERGLQAPSAAVPLAAVPPDLPLKILRMRRKLEIGDSPVWMAEDGTIVGAIPLIDLLAAVDELHALRARVAQIPCPNPLCESGRLAGSYRDPQAALEGK